MTSDEFARFRTARLAGRPAPTPVAAGDRCAIAALRTGGLAEHNPSRRALLGAAAALPFVGRHCEARSGEAIQSVACDELGTGLLRSARNDGEWSRALAAYEAAEAELRAFERRTAGARWEEQEGVERGMDARLDALRPALLRLVGTPAPDLAAAAAKIALIDAHEVATLDGGEGCLAVLMGDVLRLAKG